MNGQCPKFNAQHSNAILNDPGYAAVGARWSRFVRAIPKRFEGRAGSRFSATEFMRP